MAVHQVGNNSFGNIVARNRAVAGSIAVTTPVYATPANYGSIQAARTRLTAISATIYSAANLDKMTANDIEFALRLNDDLNTL